MITVKVKAIDGPNCDNSGKAYKKYEGYFVRMMMSQYRLPSASRSYKLSNKCYLSFECCLNTVIRKIFDDVVPQQFCSSSDIGTTTQ